MKLNKLIILFILIISLVGCAEDAENGNNGGNNGDTPNGGDQQIGSYTTNGRIVKIDEEGFHIKKGDNVDVYNIDTEDGVDYYLGEYVNLESTDGEIYKMSLDDNFSFEDITEDLFTDSPVIDVRVAEISRDETGAMRIYGLSEDNTEYDIVSHPDTMTNFQYSSLKVDDEISVYSDEISDNVPAAVRARAILNRLTNK